MILIAVIADDLTGACDTGIAFRRAGPATDVLLASGDNRWADTDADVVVYDTESRHSMPAIAAKRTAVAARHALDAGAALLYKKLDSTLRGNPPAELSALLAATGAAGVLLAPAYPAQGRATIAGRVMVHGIPLDRTGVAIDPRAPVHSADIRRLLEEQPDLRPGLLPLDTIRRGRTEMIEAIERLIRETANVIIADAETNADLAAVAGSWHERFRDRLLPAGSAGFADAIAMFVGHDYSIQTAESPVNRSGGPVIVGAGSLQDATRRQVARALRLRLFGDVAVRMEDIDGGWDRALDRTVAAARRVLGDGRYPLFRTVAPENPVSGDDSAARFIAAGIRTVAEEHDPDGLILTGGDTAVAAASAFDIRRITLVREIMPGIPLGLWHRSGLPPLPVITKAGGFGPEDAFIRLASLLGASR